MRHSCLALLLTGCALTALASPAWAQDPPIVVQVPAEASSAPNAPVVIIDGEPGSGGTPAEPAAPPIPEVWAPVPVDAAGQSAYGLYLSGRLASIRGDRAVGAELLAESHALTPEQPMLGEEAFKSGLFSGDLDTVVRLTPAVQDTPQLAQVARLVEVVQTLGAGDAGASLALLRAEPFEDWLAPAARYMTPAIAAAAGDWDAAVQPVAVPAGDAAGLILRQQRALLLEDRRRYAEADAEFRTLMAAPGGAPLFALDYAAFLERRDRRNEALIIYDAALAGNTPSTRAALGRDRVLDRARPPAPPTRLENVAEALGFAALQITQSQQPQLAAIYLRMAQSLHPSDSIAMQLAQSLTASEEPAAARAAYASVSRADPLLYARAQVSIAGSLAGEGQEEAALEILRRAEAAVPEQPAFAYAVAVQLNAMGRHEEALAILNRPYLNTADQAADVRFQRGAALESLGRLDEAENELWAALQAAPNEPVLLNYLGYMWVDSGRRVDQGAEMLARAHAADPDNGNIQDSLGWAQFRQGQYETAVQTLEGAVGKEPANAEIVDHLGDAYWQVGRRREAEWQWSRVLTLEPDAERRAEVEQKLSRGLPEPTPVSDSQS
jgi:Flp pilus assembly protein TadD